MISIESDSKELAAELDKMSGIILCGGLSKRFGRNKALLPYAGKTLVEHSILLLQELFSELLLVTDKPESFEDISSNIVRDIIPEKGPMLGVLSGLIASSKERIFVMPCHMPRIDRQLILNLCLQERSRPVLLFSAGGKLNPLLGIYDKSCLEDLEDIVLSAGGDASTLEQLKSRDMIEEFVQKETDCFSVSFSVDEPADYARLLGARHLN